MSKATRRFGWVTAGLAAAAVGGGAATLARRRRPLVQAAHPELRKPFLYLPTPLTSTRTLEVINKALASWEPPAPEGVDLRTVEVPARDGVPPVRVLCYETVERERPSGALVWIHGGGFVLGVPEQAHDWCARVAVEAGLLVVSVDYRLAPDHPFPTGLDDSMSALRWVHEHAEELGVDPTRVAVGGDSAGGGMAASVAQRARDEGDLPLAFQLLVYPMLDDRTIERARRDGLDTLIWTPASNDFAWNAYLGGRTATGTPPRYTAPGRTEDLAGLPPAWVGVGDIDLFHDEDVDYAERLEAVGVPTRFHLEPGLFHGSDSVFPNTTPARSFRDDALETLRAFVG